MSSHSSHSSDSPISDVSVPSPSSEENTTGFRYLTTFAGHQRDITVLKFSPCGKWVASGSEDGLVRIWSLKDGSLHKELSGNRTGVNDIAWHEDVTMLATGGDDHTVKIYDLKLDVRNHNTLFISHSASLKEHKALVLCVALKCCYIERERAYVNLLASGSNDNNVIIWDADKRDVETRKKLVGHEEPITAVDFNGNGTLLMSSSYDGSVRLWDSFNGEHLFTLVAKNTPVAYSHFIREDDWYVHMAMLNDTIELWSFKGLDRTLVRTYQGHRNKLYPLCSGTCGGKYILSCSEDGAIYIWPISGGNPEKLSFSRPEGPIIAFDIHPHGAMIAYSHISQANDKDSTKPAYRKIDIWINDQLK